MTEPWQSRGEYNRAMAEYGRVCKARGTESMAGYMTRPWQSLTKQRGQSSSRVWLCVIEPHAAEQGGAIPVSSLSSILCYTHVQGQVSAYFTVFAPPYLPIHTTKIEKADEVYARNVGTHLLKVTINSCPQTFPTIQTEG